MAKLLTLFTLLPKAHQITLSLLVMLTTIILMFPSEDAQASKQTQLVNPSTDTNSTETNSQYSVPLAFRTPTAPTIAKDDNTEEIADNIFDNSSLSPQKRNVSDDAVSETADDQAFAQHIAMLQTRPEGMDGVIKELDNQLIKQKEKLAQQASSDDYTVEYYEVAKGDTLGGLFSRAGLSAKDVYDITQLPLAKKNLLTIMPGEEIAISKNELGELKELSYRMDKVSTLVISHSDDKYKEVVNTKKVQSRTSFITATIKSNFWNAAADAGLSGNHIMELANIFGWDVDFALDIRKGDHFSLLFDQEYADGQFLRNGNILAAEFVNQGERYTAVRYTDGEYYSENGNSMRKAFLRSPVDFKYVSSNFNPRRLHPVTGQIKAHRGVDYVAAIGTPIKAAGKGKVIESGYNQFNGNYVFIKHNETYTTKYLHLTKRKVNRGDTVKQGQVIGTLGKTGRVTGAHLHYEFIVNGVHRNPRTVDLPKSMPINRSEKGKFTSLSKQLMAQLKSNQQQQLASN
ncbi:MULTISPECIES: peptidoglycan DD-metalloendopeptidase family protein [Shewanella]|jgi:murein DD-endopeptidase MepM/ murein hydrolase activator NlpD|uniref:peptidoglycan DD-metalloendopeptidase family protein n=2 Tax=Shewanellaceae TaxID=267890 RepID=UPI00200E86AC|nr:peptidoglycan DD-metalloendopeptidase family protein [Shewanella basaltis]MCL1113295.1 peptidoglycan DD-metalloendopeptidase family protein [Shewanella basaltis]